MPAIPVREQRASVLLRAKIELFGGRVNQAAGRFWMHPNFPLAYREYLFQSHSIIRATVPLMQAGEQACRLPPHASDPALQTFGDYLRRHIPEETGHHEWILDDGEAMGIKRVAILDRLPRHTVTHLVGAQYYWLHHYSPIALAGYIAVMEGIPSTTEFYEDVARRNQLPPTAFTNFLYHARIDPRHRQEFDDMLDGLPLSKDQLGLIGLSAIRTMDYIAGILEDIVLEAEPSGGFSNGASP
ncbi:MAG TPA: iron-containing redox enzyme family protein [Bryobacteraceae bacterium]